MAALLKKKTHLFPSPTLLALPNAFLML